MAKKKVSSPQRRKQKTAHGAHGGNNEYELEEIDSAFKVHDYLQKDKDKPEDAKALALNKEAGYNESLRRVEALLETKSA